MLKLTHSQCPSTPIYKSKNIPYTLNTRIYSSNSKSKYVSNIRIRNNVSITKSKFTSIPILKKQNRNILSKPDDIIDNSRCNAIEICNAEKLEVALANRNKLMIIDFYATWCGPCLLMAKELEKVNEKFGEKISILKIDTDENEELSTHLKIQGLPTLMFIGTNAEKPALRTEGYLPAEAVIQILENEL